MSGAALAGVCGSDGRISAHGDGVLIQRLYAEALHQKLSCTGSATGQTSYQQYLNTATFKGRMNMTVSAGDVLMKPEVIG